jgi:hypothetical protein
MTEISRSQQVILSTDDKGIIRVRNTRENDAAAFAATTVYAARLLRGEARYMYQLS